MKEEMQEEKQVDFSKLMLKDTRALLWIISIGGLLLAAYAIHKGFTGALAWITSLMGLHWASEATKYAFYTNMAKSDHSVGGITHDMAMLEMSQEGSVESPAI